MKKFFSFVLATAFSLTAFPAYADGPDMVSALESLKQQVAMLQKTVEAQNLRIQQLESHKVIETPQPSVTVEPSSVDSLKQNIGEAIPWLKGLKQSGDLRLRYEAFDYMDRQSDAGSVTGSADRTRNRFRFRLRWGVEKDFMDDWKAGFRLATGSSTDQTTTNQTLGNPGYFVPKSFFVDRAYATYEPSALKDQGALKNVKIGAGKFENPFLRYSTGIVWDGDVAPEGAYEQANFALIAADDNKLNLQTTAGQFIVNEGAPVESDAAIFGYQGVLSWSTKQFGTPDPVELNLAGSFYDYTNWFQTVLASGNSAATSYLRTNSIVADDFRVLDLYPELTINVNGNPLTLWYDYAANLANVGTDDVVQSGGNDIHDSDEAWGVGFKLGKTKKKGSWDVFYGYYEIGANAVVAAFNEGDFGGPATNGFTNRKGHKFGLDYQLTDSLTLGWTAFYVEPLNPFAGNAVLGLQNASNEDVFRSQLDLVYKF